MHTSVAIKRNEKPLNWKRGNCYSLIIQEIYQHIGLDTSKHCLERNGDHLTTTVCSVLKLRSIELEDAWQNSSLIILHKSGANVSLGHFCSGSTALVLTLWY